MAARTVTTRSAASEPAASAAFGALETRQSLTAAQIDALARELLALLTLDEKIGMMSGDRHFFEGFLDASRGGYRRHPLNTAGAVPRLDIPGVIFSDGPRGVMLAGATTFPQGSARGATWDSHLEERIGEAMGREARAHGANVIGAPCVNLLRHPAWGRAQESYGEDPYHLGEMGAALVRGIQRHVMACPKHFALNSMENARFKVDVRVDQRTLHEVYLPHFRRVVKEGAASVMSAYNSVNGEWCGQNRDLLTGILQDQWGFEGFVQSDWLFGVRDARKAALAGQHLEMPWRNLYDRFLPDLVESGEVPLAVVDDAAFRILRQLVRFGQGRDPRDYAPEVIGCEAHRRLAREAAQKSIVLLKNEDVLPLRDVEDVTVFGRLADLPNTGDHGSSNTQPPYVVTPLQGLRAAQGAPFRIQYEEGDDLERAAVMARFCDVAIVVVGYTWRDEGEYLAPDEEGPWTEHLPKEPLTRGDAPFARQVAALNKALGPGAGVAGLGGDRTSLTLRPEDEALILTVAAANPRTVVVIMAGSTVITEAWRDKAAAILMLWYPGQEGGHALADVLLGHVNPSGRLPCVFPQRAEDLPWFDRNATRITYDLWHGYRKLERDGVAPAFPFGFGLSYTDFTLRNLQLADARIETNGALVATVEIRNAGKVPGEEVIQLYVGARDSRVERARKELKAFARVALMPGETRAVRLAVPAAELAWYDAARGWVVEPGDYEVFVGRHSLDDSALRADFIIA